MKHDRTVVVLQWPGLDSLKAARDAINSGSEVEIELPAGTHYVLHRQLHPGEAASVAERIDASGGAEMLAAIAAVRGLEELARLRRAVSRAHYRVRLTSPEPLLRLLPREHAKA